MRGAAEGNKPPTKVEPEKPSHKSCFSAPQNLENFLVRLLVAPLRATHFEHHTATVAGEIVDLGKGGYAAFGTVGYGGDVEFDDIQVDSSSD